MNYVEVFYIFSCTKLTVMYYVVMTHSSIHKLICYSCIKKKLRKRRECFYVSREHSGPIAQFILSKSCSDCVIFSIYLCLNMSANLKVSTRKEVDGMFSCFEVSYNVPETEAASFQKPKQIICLHFSVIRVDFLKAFYYQ